VKFHATGCDSDGKRSSQVRWWPVYLTFYALRVLLFEASKFFGRPPTVKLLRQTWAEGTDNFSAGQSQQTTCLLWSPPSFLSWLYRLNWWRAAGSQGFVNPLFPASHTDSKYSASVLCTRLYRKRNWFGCIWWTLCSLYIRRLYTTKYTAANRCIPLSISKRIYRSAGMLLRHDFLYSAVIPVNGRKLNPLSVLFYFQMYYGVLICQTQQTAN
jgi:hypothetical protein